MEYYNLRIGIYEVMGFNELANEDKEIVNRLAFSFNTNPPSKAKPNY